MTCVMAKKHYDNKNDLLKAVRKQKMENEMVMAATYTAYMRMALLTLHDEFGFGTQRCEKFAVAMNAMLEKFNDGSITGNQMTQRIMDELSLYMEDPKLPEWVTDRMLK